jgi:hypothetical protein
MSDECVTGMYAVKMSSKPEEYNVVDMLQLNYDLFWLLRAIALRRVRRVAPREDEMRRQHQASRPLLILLQSGLFCLSCRTVHHATLAAWAVLLVPCAILVTHTNSTAGLSASILPSTSLTSLPLSLHSHKSSQATI